MLTEKDNIRCKSVFDDKREHRFLWERIWDKDKPMALVISLNPCAADGLIMDTTSYLIVNNIVRLEKYGGVAVVNLFSKMTSKLNFRWNSDEDLNDPVNDSYIRKYAEECDTVIAAWGRSGDTNQRISNRIERVMELLNGLEQKIYLIGDGSRVGLHPLTPSIRHEWRLIPFEVQTKEIKEDDEQVTLPSAGSQKNDEES